MIDFEINEYIRLVGSLSLGNAEKERITDYVIKNSLGRREIQGKHVAVASAVAVLAVGTIFIARGSRYKM